MAINFLNTVAVDENVLFVDTVNDRVGIGTASPARTLQVGDGTADDSIGVYYSDGSHTRIHGYGLYMSRTASYIRPLTTTTQTLYVGAPTNIWNAIVNNANTHYFSTGANEHMRINSLGNVGIGTTGPNHRLTVNAPNDTTAVGIDFPSAHFDFSANSTSGYTSNFRLNDVGMDIGHNSTSRSLNLQTGDLDRVTILGNGNVGIGVTAPQKKLSVYGDTLIESSGLTASLWFRPSPTYNAGGIQTMKVTGSGNPYHTTTSFSNYNAANVLNIVNDNVGIGTTNPSRKLQVIGTDGVAKFYYNSSFTNAQYTVIDVGMMTSGTAADGFGPKISFRMGGNGYDGYQTATIGTKRSGADNTHDLTFSTSSSGAVSDKMIIKSNGNVGIGTTLPGSKLEVNGSIDAGGDGYLINGKAWAFEMSDVLTLGDWDGQDMSTRIMDNNSSEVLRVTDGKVGIGTTSPAQKLDVAGIIQSNANGFQINTGGYGYARLRAYYGALNTSTSIFVGGVNGYSYQPVYASAFNVSSDYRLKTNVVDLEEAIERVKQINVHRFNWNDRLDEEKVDGFLAHELAEVIPEAVTGEKDAVREDGTLNYQGVDQSKVVPLLTAALKEAIDKIEQLETRIQTLENN